MNSFASAREAKEFLVSRIVDEAQRENAPLSEVERKMLYFSETDWTLPDMMDVNGEFDRTCDQGEYEKKIARLIGNAYNRTLKDAPEERDTWWAAIRLLEKEDHYILVMVRAGMRPRGDTLRLWGTACVVAIFVVFGVFLGLYIPDRYWPSRETLAFAIWVTMASVVLGYVLLRLVFGARKTDDLTSRLVGKLFRIPEHRK